MRAQKQPGGVCALSTVASLLDPLVTGHFSRLESRLSVGGVAWGGEPSCHGSSNQGMSQLLLQSFLQEKICARAPFLYMYVYL